MGEKKPILYRVDVVALIPTVYILKGFSFTSKGLEGAEVQSNQS